MHFLVTGGAGFIGSHTVERLLSYRHKVSILDDFNDFYDPQIKRENIKRFSSDVEVLECDIRDAVAVERAFAKGKFDVVVHLAARAGVRPSLVDPKLYLTTNIDGTYNLLDACRYHGIKKFIFASSSSVYGVNKKVPFSEHDLIERTISPYAATKLSGEQLCANFAHLYKIQTVCLRFFTVYGPRQRPDLAIAKFAKKILNGEPIQQYGDGSTARDYTYIEDIVSGIEKAIKFDGNDFDIFNIGGSELTSLSTLIGVLERKLNRTAIIEKMPEQLGDVPITYADIEKARDVLGYESATSIEEGIAKYINWLKV